MDSIKELFTDIFNLDKKRQSLSPGQVGGILAIVLFLLPVMFYSFGFLALPAAYLIEFIFEPRNGIALYAAKLAVYFIKLVFGLAGSIWICSYVWPRRKPASEWPDSAMNDGPGKTLIIIGVVVTMIGVIVLFRDSIPFLRHFGRLPGDINIERENFSLHFPLVTGIIISIILSLVIYVIGRFKWTVAARDAL
jgi:hypothetical protein